MLLFVEGIPGSGKTTWAAKLADHYSQQGFDVVCCREHSPRNPLDLTRKAVLDDGSYRSIVDGIARKLKNSGTPHEDLAAFKRQLDFATMTINDWRIVSYLYLDLPERIGNDGLWSLRSHEVCDGRATAEEYESLIQALFLMFSKKCRSEAVYVFDGTLMQNILFELLGQHMYSFVELKRFYLELLSPLKGMDIRVHFVEVENVPARFEEVSNTRRSEHWAQRIDDWYHNTAWANAHGAADSGIIDYLCHQQRISKSLVTYLASKGVVTSFEVVK